MKYVKLLLIIGLVGSVFYGLFVAMGVINTSPVGPDPVELDPTIVVVEEDNVSIDNLSADLSRYLERLSAEGVRFAEVREMSEWVNQNSDRSNEIQDFDSFKEKVDAYMEIISIVNGDKCSWEEIQKFVKGKKSQLIDTVHLKYLIATYCHGKNRNGVEILIQPKEYNDVNTALKRASMDIKSFKDIPSAKSILNNRQSGSAKINHADTGYVR